MTVEASAGPDFDLQPDPRILPMLGEIRPASKWVAVPSAVRSRFPVTRKALENLPVSELKAMYEKAALLSGHTSESGDHRTGSKQYDLIISIRRELKRRGDEGGLAILDLMNNASPWVRFWAAAYALHLDPGRAERVLQDLASGSGPCSFEAEMTLSEWRKGHLTPQD